MTTTGPGALFRDGKLAEAVAAAEQRLRAAPTEAAARLLLAELLLFAGQFERADAVLVAAEAVDPSLAIVTAEYRQLLRAAAARLELFTHGRLPEFLGEPTQAQTCLLRALVALRASDAQAASAAAEEAERYRPDCPGRANGAVFADFRDADDLFGGTLEVLTTTGKYYWIPIERVTSMVFHAPRRVRDLFWRRCTMSVRDGPDGEVYIPAIYATGNGDETDEADSLRLGRRTDWSESAPVRGVGQRMFLVGEEGVPINRLESVDFA
ncbi:MAG TPA: type VI secretion system accessory protein TagJ [Acetobacteraceae bacterium]|nr:type VI secretion system accessory protein TagJ [Acetobacteraceae bacterium]